MCESPVRSQRRQEGKTTTTTKVLSRTKGVVSRTETMSFRNEYNHISGIVLLMVILITLMANTMASPLPDYAESQAKFNCPESANCSCSLMITDYDIQCTISEPQIIVRIQLNTYVQIECTTMDERVYNLLPPMNIGDIQTVQIRRCPLPTGRSIQDILEYLGIKRIRSLIFQNYRADLGNTLVREHLRGLGELQRLALSGNGLSDLPEDLFMDLGNLTWLDLKSNKVHLPRNIFLTLEKLDYLELGYNNLQHLEEGVFRNQKRLKHLNLWGNNLLNLSQSAFEGVESVAELDLSSNNIETFRPDVFALLINLTNINLSTNRILSLPEGLFEHNKKLRKFRLLNNRINLEKLPEGLLSNLPELEDVQIKCDLENMPDNLFSGSINIKNITLANNRIGDIPSGLLAEQTNLLELDLSYNLLMELPDHLFTHTKELRVLKLSHNQLVNISRIIFSQLHSLREIYLDNNDLYRIHSNSFSGAPSLEIIDLHNNHLSFTDEETGLFMSHRHELVSPFQSLNELRSLNLRNNSISHIFRDWIFNNIRLNDLDLSYNNISMITYSDLQFLSRRITVNLTHNLIMEIDLREIEIVAAGQEFQTLESNVVILLESNPIVCNCILLYFVQFIRNELASDVKKILQVIPGDLKCIQPNNLEGRLVSDLHPKELLCPLDSELSSYKRCPSECNCMVRPADKTLIVNCSNAGLTKVPALPRPRSLGLLYTELYIENNFLVKLPHFDTPGYSDVREIFAKNNNITKFTTDNIPRNLTLIDLSNNNLERINSSVFESLNRTSKLERILLSENPWICDCKALTLLEFVQKNFKKIPDLSRMQCVSGGKLSSISPNDLCSQNGLIVGASVIIALLSFTIGILAALYYKYQQEVKIWLYAHNMCLWFVTENELDKDKKYDAFISYSHKDEEFIADHLVPTLENNSTPFKLCLHTRDWCPGLAIPDQITNSVEDARRTIVVLSPNFLESIWARMEFRAAHTAALSEGRARVIVIIYGDIGDTDGLDKDLKAYLTMNTYVKWGDPWFWDKLRYAMPHPTTPNTTKGLVKTAIKSSTDDKLELIKPVPVTPPLTTPPAEQASKNPLVAKLNGEINQNGKIPNGGNNGINGHVNGAFIINTNAKQSDV